MFVKPHPWDVLDKYRVTEKAPASREELEEEKALLERELDDLYSKQDEIDSDIESVKYELSRVITDLGAFGIVGKKGEPAGL
jgi:chromosome segregation ATPase